MRSPKTNNRVVVKPGGGLSGPHGGGRDWMLWAAIGLALLTTLVGLASIFLP